MNFFCLLAAAACVAECRGQMTTEEGRLFETPKLGRGSRASAFFHGDDHHSAFDKRGHCATSVLNEHKTMLHGKLDYSGERLAQNCRWLCSQKAGSCDAISCYVGDPDLLTRNTKNCFLHGDFSSGSTDFGDYEPTFVAPFRSMFFSREQNSKRDIVRAIGGGSGGGKPTQCEVKVSNCPMDPGDKGDRRE